MKAPDTDSAGWLRDRDLLRAAVAFTATQTGFAELLIEKDSICTLLLKHLASVEGLVFKGGTCLAKVHTSFYRLSEDLDFVIPMPTGATRRQRSARTADLKRTVAELPAKLPMLRLVERLRGANDSRQYLAAAGYVSVVSGIEETITLEIGLREPLLEAPLSADAATVLRHPATNAPLIAPVRLACMSLRESLAEKARAALTRRDPAIRDFFDLDYTARVLGSDLGEPALIEFTRAKLAVPGNGPIDLSAERFADLRSQVDARLRPVLRPADFAAFDLDRAFTIVSAMAAKIGTPR
jgi:predicted nucleotidyltransferase component of viral defense system